MLLMWGDNFFETGGASFEELTHRFGGRWAKAPVFGRRAPGQYLGPGEEEISLKGLIYPVDMGIDTFQTVVAMQKSAGSGAVDMLISGAGDCFGLFRLDELEYRASNHLPDGTPQKVEYTLKFSAAVDIADAIWAVWP